MLYSLLTSFINEFSFLNVFRYLTFRTGLSLISSFIIVFLIGGPFIKYFSQKKITGPIREDGPTDHIFKKVGTIKSFLIFNSFKTFFTIFSWHKWIGSKLPPNTAILFIRNIITKFW